MTHHRMRDTPPMSFGGDAFDKVDAYHTSRRKGTCPSHRPPDTHLGRRVFRDSHLNGPMSQLARGPRAAPTCAGGHVAFASGYDMARRAQRPFGPVRHGIVVCASTPYRERSLDTRGRVHRACARRDSLTLALCHVSFTLAYDVQRCVALALWEHLAKCPSTAGDGCMCIASDKETRSE